MRTIPYGLDEGEQLMASVAFTTSGCLPALLGIVGFLMPPRPSGAELTDRRLIKRFGKNRMISLAWPRVEKVFLNATSNSFAFVASPDRSVFLWWLASRGRRDSIRIPLVANAAEIKAVIASLGIPLEEERLSPRRRFMR